MNIKEERLRSQLAESVTLPIAEWTKILDQLETYEEALSWYAMEWLYRMESFVTSEGLHDVNGPPRNKEVHGSPINHDSGKRARDALQKFTGEKV